VVRLVAGPAAAGAPVAAPWKGHRLTDPQGTAALAWWAPDGWRVVSDDAAFRGRVVRALRRPIEVREDALGPDGIPSSYQVEIWPTDLRYPVRLASHWAQIGLGDVAVEVVQLREPTPDEEAWLAAARERLRQGRLPEAPRLDCG
jgi:hypothetical protein